MGNFFKKIGTGALVILLSPFALVGFALFTVFSVLKLIVLWVKAIAKYFVGERITDPLEIERQALKLFEKEQLDKKKTLENSNEGKFAGATINIYGNTSNPLMPPMNSRVDVIEEAQTPKEIGQTKALEYDPLSDLLGVKKDD